MTILAWQRGGAPAGPAVVLAHDWGADAATWQDAGWVGTLERAGLALYVADLPGHGESADVLMPPDAEPAAWSAATMLNDLDRLGVARFAVAGHGAGCLVAGHAAARAPERVTRLVLVGCDDGPLLPDRDEVASAVADPAARVWHAEAAAAVARARRDRRHHLPTLAHWARSAQWPAAARLGALRTAVLLAVASDGPHRRGAPRLAALFHDAHLVTVPGDAESLLAAPELGDAVVAFLRELPPP